MLVWPTLKITTESDDKMRHVFTNFYQLKPLGHAIVSFEMSGSIPTGESVVVQIQLMMAPVSLNSCSTVGSVALA